MFVSVLGLGAGASGCVDFSQSIRTLAHSDGLSAPVAEFGMWLIRFVSPSALRLNEVPRGGFASQARSIYGRINVGFRCALVLSFAFSIIFWLAQRPLRYSLTVSQDHSRRPPPLLADIQHPSFPREAIFFTSSAIEPQGSPFGAPRLWIAIRVKAHDKRKSPPSFR